MNGAEAVILNIDSCQPMAQTRARVRRPESIVKAWSAGPGRSVGPLGPIRPLPHATRLVAWERSRVQRDLVRLGGGTRTQMMMSAVGEVKSLSRGETHDFSTVRLIRPAKPTYTVGTRHMSSPDKCQTWNTTSQWLPHVVSTNKMITLSEHARYLAPS